MQLRHKKQVLTILVFLGVVVLASAGATVAYLSGSNFSHFKTKLNKFKADSSLFIRNFPGSKIKPSSGTNNSSSSASTSNQPSCNEQQALAQAKACTYLVRTDQGHGSGFAVSDKYLVTNKHVIEQASEITTWTGQENIYLDLWAYSQDVDLAVLKTRDNSKKLTSCNWADSASIQLAETLYAVGWPNSPDGESSITRGIFSRFIQTDQGPLFIQTDAAINPGNSGGPLVNQCGIVGINTAKIVWSEQNVPAEGFSFAIAANYAQSQVQELVEQGSVKELPVKDLSQTKYTPQTMTPSQAPAQTNFIIPEDVKQSWREASQATNEMDQYWQQHSAGVDQAKLEKLKDIIARMKAVIQIVLPKIEASKPLTQPEEQLIDQWNQMYQQALALEGQLHQRDYSQGYYHYQCQNNACALVGGRGFDGCQSANDCLPEYHYECSQMSCMVVEGAGENTCSSHDDCYHLVCQDNQCKKQPGDGTDQCYWDFQCQ